ncbi:hypothetical protein OQA88_3322 [Cercophora sp. LCS_1]
MDQQTSPLQKLAIAIVIFFPALALLVLGLRLYSKSSRRALGPGTFRHPSTLLGPDDLCCTLAMMVSIGLTVGSYFYIKANCVGITIDPSVMPEPEELKTAFVWAYVVQLLYFPVLALTKCSVLYFLLRLGGQSRGTRILIYTMIALNLGLMLGIFGASAGQCVPISFYWDKSVGGSCINQPVFYLVQAGVNIFTDIITLGVPIWIFLHMKMERRMKIVTLYVFLLGFIVTLIGIIRLVFLYMLFYYNIFEIKHFTMSFVLSAVETNLAIVCACAPTLRGLVRSWFPRALAAEQFANTDDPYVEAKSPSSAGVRQGNRTSFGDCMFGYPKEARGRAQVEVEGLGLTPSEEDIMRDNVRTNARTTDAIVERDDGSSRGDEEGIGRRVSGDSIWVRSRFPRG